LWEDYICGQVPLTDAEIARMRDGHAECIGYMLDRFAEFIVEIEATGRPTRLILMADHGDLLGEQGIVGHTIAPGPELYQVPLLTMSFGLGDPAPAAVSTPVILTDVFDTVLAWSATPPPVGLARDRFHPGLTLDDARAANAPERTFAIWFGLPSYHMGSLADTASKAPDKYAAARRVAALEMPSVTIVRGPAMVTYDADGHVITYGNNADGSNGSARTVTTGTSDPAMDDWLDWRSQTRLPPSVAGGLTNLRPVTELMRGMGLFPEKSPTPRETPR
jgi:hypothetical protein